MQRERMGDHMKQVGLYGGSFNPIHFGHLNLAIELMEKGHLDEVWFIPTPLNPHKIGQEPVSFHDRKVMIELAVRDIPQFYMKDLEGKRTHPAYTVDTLKEILTAAGHDPYPSQFHLLLGEDILPDFFRWRSPEEIVSLVPLLIGSRTGEWTPSFKENQTSHAPIYSAIYSGMIKTHMMDISSTAIRDRLAKGLYCGHLVPAPVLDYIYSRRLYVTSSIFNDQKGS